MSNIHTITVSENDLTLIRSALLSGSASERRDRLVRMITKTLPKTDRQEVRCSECPFHAGDRTALFNHFLTHGYTSDPADADVYAGSAVDYVWSRPQYRIL